MKIRIALIVMLGSIAIGYVTAKIVHRLRGDISDAQEVKTENKQQAWFQENFSKNVAETSISNDSFQVRFRGFCQNVSEDPTQFLVLHPGDRFCPRPDQHGHSELTLEKIEGHRVTIHYFTTFNYSSFGKPLIETDEGSFEWPMR